MKINCLHCGHGFAVDDSYCDYEGLLRCPTCGGLLEARFQDGLVKSVRPGVLHAAAPAAVDAPSAAAEQTAIASPVVQTPTAPHLVQDGDHETRRAA